MRAWTGAFLAAMSLLAACGRDFDATDGGRTERPSESTAALRPAEKPIDWKALERMREFQGLFEWKELPAAKGGWHRLPINAVVSEQCVADFGTSAMVETVRGGIAGGMSCLAGLGGDGSTRLLREMRALFSDPRTPVKISCRQRAPFGPRTLALATGPGDAGHPNITLNPVEWGKTKLEERQATLFHELFHNLGYMHYIGIEYAYACQVCCFRGESPEAQDAACKVCKTDYGSVDSPKYVREAADFLAKMYRGEHAAKVVDHHLEKNPSSREFSTQFAYHYRFAAPAFAYGLASKLEKRFGDFTDAEKAQLHAAKAGDKLPVSHLAGGSLLGEAYWSLIRQEMDAVQRNLGAYTKLKLEEKGDAEEKESAEDLNRIHLDLAWRAYFHFRKKGIAATDPDERKRFEERSNDIYELLIKNREAKR